IVQVLQGNRGFGLERIEGVDWEPFAAMNGISLIAGRAPQANDEVVVDETKARNNQVTVGSTLNLIGDKPYRVVGIYSPESTARVKMSLRAMQEAFEAIDKCTYIMVKVRDGSDKGAVAKRIAEQLPGNKVQFTEDVFMSPERSIPYLPVFLRVLVGLAAVVSAVVVMLAMYTTITERTREIGILKALGASRGYIIGLIEKEAMLISFIGLIAGFIVSLFAGYLIHRFYGLFFEFSWAWAITAATIGLVGGAVGALYPAIRAANLDPVSALAYE